MYYTFSTCIILTKPLAHYLVLSQFASIFYTLNHAYSNFRTLSQLELYYSTFIILFSLNHTIQLDHTIQIDHTIQLLSYLLNFQHTFLFFFNLNQTCIIFTQHVSYLLNLYYIYSTCIILYSSCIILTYYIYMIC